MKRGLLFLLLWPLASARLGATEYHVAKTGNDQNAGTVNRPLLTIQKCAHLAGAGDRCLIQAGSYYERVSPPNFGAADNLIVFQASGTVVIRGFTLRTGYVRVQGFEITDTPNIFPDAYGVYLEGEGYEVLDNLIHHTTWDGINCSKSGPSVARALIRGNTIRYADGTGITLYGQANVAERNDISHILNITGRDADGIRFFGQGHVIRDNVIHDITEAEAPGAHTDAMQTFDNSQPPTNDVLIEGNYCYNVDHQMLMLSAQTKRQSSRITIRNNIFESPYSPPSWQLIYVIQVTQVAVVHNTFINARYRGLYIGDRATQATIKNNIFYNVPRYYEIETNSLRGFRVGHNLNYPSAYPASEPGGVYQDPQFRDLANGDFHLKETSPTIDAGEDVSVSLDKDANPRPQGRAPDIGAFEFVAPTGVKPGTVAASEDIGTVAPAWKTVSGVDRGLHLYPSVSKEGLHERLSRRVIRDRGRWNMRSARILSGRWASSSNSVLL